MATVDTQTSPLIVIVGPTASGKTSLAIELAEKFGGEIICADSRTVYKEMNIGTAKPTALEQARVPHWGLDLIEPGKRFTAAHFKAYADKKIHEIRHRGNIPFLVGGTGLYVDSVLFDYTFGGEVDESLRHKLNSQSLEELHDYCKKNNIILPENNLNKRYVIRAIERDSAHLERRSKPISTSIIVGISTDKAILRKRINQRTEQLFNNGVVEEATKLGKKYSWNNEAMTGNIYPLVRDYLVGQYTLQEIKDKFTTLDWKLAKRQLTYLRRNNFIKWMSLTEAKDYISSCLAIEQKS